MEDSATRITITICGDGGCGKSSITLRLVRSQWTHEYDPTIEDSYTLTRRIDGQTYHLSLTDTAGQEEYRGMFSSNLLHSDAFLLVYDITSFSSLEQLDYFNDMIDMEAETGEDAHRERQKSRGKWVKGEGGFVRPVKIVAGNKCDLQSARQVSAKEGLEWARRHGCGFMETSARNTVNIEETFALIVRRVIEARRVAMIGLEGDSARDEGRTSGGHMLGTRRAETAPLTPLPNGPEKDMTFPPPETTLRPNNFMEFLRRLQCWR